MAIDSFICGQGSYCIGFEEEFVDREEFSEFDQPDSAGKYNLVKTYTESNN